MIESDIRHTDALVAEHSIDDILLIGIIIVVDEHLAAYRHIERIFILVNRVIRRFSRNGIVYLKRVAQSVRVGEVDDIGIYTHRHILVEGQTQDLFLRGVKRTVRPIDGKPRRQRLDRVRMSLTGEVTDDNIGVIIGYIVSIGSSLVHRMVLPFQCVLVHKDGPCDRRGHRVTVEVLHIADSDIDRLFVDLAVAHVEVDHQLIVIERPVKIHLGQLTDILYRSGEGAIAQIHHIRRIGYTEDQRLDLIHYIALGCLKLPFVVDGEDLLQDAVVVLLHLLEGQISHQTHLVASRRERTIGAHQ